MVTKKRKQKLNKREHTRRRKLSERMPNGKWRFTYRDTPKGLARYDAKTGKTVYLYTH